MQTRVYHDIYGFVIWEMEDLEAAMGTGVSLTVSVAFLVRNYFCLSDDDDVCECLCV